AHDEHGQRPERGPDRADPRLVGVRPHGGELTGMRQFIRPWLWAVGVYFALDLLISLLVGTANPLWFLLCPFLAAVAADWVHALHGRPLERDHLIAVFAMPVVLAVSQAVIGMFNGVFA